MLEPLVELQMGARTQPQSDPKSLLLKLQWDASGDRRQGRHMLPRTSLYF